MQTRQPHNPTHQSLNSPPPKAPPGHPVPTCQNKAARHAFGSSLARKAPKTHQPNQPSCPDISQTTLPTRHPITPGTSLYQKIPNTWSNRNRGKLHLTQILAQTTRNVFTISHPNPPPDNPSHPPKTGNGPCQPPQNSTTPSRLSTKSSP